MSRQQRNGNNGRQRGLPHNAQIQREPRSFAIKIMNAKDAKFNDVTVLRMCSRDEKFMAEFPHTNQCLRGEAIRFPIEPELPPQNGNQGQREMRKVAYQAQYTSYVKQTEAIRQKCMNIQARVHHSVLDKAFRIDFEPRGLYRSRQRFLQPDDLDPSKPTQTYSQERMVGLKTERIRIIGRI